MNFEFSCDIGHIKLDVPHQIWEAVTSDGNANTLVTRFFHNTPSFMANNLLKCYLSYFSPEFINQTFSLIGLVFFVLGLWHLVVKKNWLVLFFLFLAPLSPLFDFPASGLWQGIILYLALGTVMFFGIINTWQKLKSFRH